MKAESGAPALVVRGLSKTFGGVRALDQVDLALFPGEVHGLLGENGSGKSTLIKILAGFHAPDGGELEVFGRPVKLPLPAGQARALGMSFVHQDLGLIPTLSVLENLRITEWALRTDWRISWSEERRKALEAFRRYGVDLDPDERVFGLRPVEKALLAIVRALEDLRDAPGGDGRPALLVLDEPTVFLPRSEVDQFFAVIREVAREGSAVLFVSHDLDEVREITDRVTVLRDGRVVGTVVTKEVAKDQLVEMIVGRRVAQLSFEHHDLTAVQPATRIAELSGAAVSGVSFDAHNGEILGLTGLVGSGFEDVPYLLFGALRATSGRLTIGGKSHDLRFMTPGDALEAGLALVPGDRQRDGSVGSLSVAENVSLLVLDRFRSWLGLNWGRIYGESASRLGEYQVRPNAPRMRYSSLSGGNQQKVVLAKWLQTKPKLLLLHEPTQGVDVGARQEIFTMLRQIADRGTSIVCASSDYEQLAAVCDRVLVFARGRAVEQLVGEAITKERITERCLQSLALADATAEAA